MSNFIKNFLPNKKSSDIFLGISHMAKQAKNIDERMSGPRLLQHLNISNNQIKELPEEIKKLANLQELDIRNNQLCKSTIQELRKALPNTNM